VGSAAIDTLESKRSLRIDMPWAISIIYHHLLILNIFLRSFTGERLILTFMQTSRRGDYSVIPLVFRRDYHITRLFL
jgi:hypothetical protein